MLNQITLMGRLTHDPELRVTPKGISVASFAVAVNRDYERDKADFINVIAWRSTADFVEKYFHKGDTIALTGSLQMREWRDKDNNRRISAEVVANSVYFCGQKRESNSTQRDDYAPRGLEDVGPDDDGELPF